MFFLSNILNNSILLNVIQFLINKSFNIDEENSFISIKIFCNYLLEYIVVFIKLSHYFKIINHFLEVKVLYFLNFLFLFNC